MTELIGRLHPMLVHLPIGFLVLLGLVELLALSLRGRHLTSARGAIVALTVPAAIISATCGWLLSWSGGYEPNLLDWHKWLGTSLAGATVILFFVQRSAKETPYRLALIATLGLLVVTGHFGGSLTHGDDFITAPLQKLLGLKTATAPAAPEKSAAVFASSIQPLFNDYCVGCHGPQKSKGKMRLDSYAALEKGGEAGAAIVPGSADLSLLCKRMALPADDEDHMPPEGKRQPTVEEVALLRWWIDSGASADKSAAELKPPAEILKTIQARSQIAH